MYNRYNHKTDNNQISNKQVSEIINKESTADSKQTDRTFKTHI